MRVLKDLTAKSRRSNGSEWSRHPRPRHGAWLTLPTSVKTNTIHNPASARVSVPGIIVPAPEGSPPSTPAYLWRTPLRSTAPYWTSMLMVHGSALKPVKFPNLYRLVHRPVEQVLVGADRSPAYPCRYRAPGQGAHDWTNAGEVPAGRDPWGRPYGPRGASLQYTSARPHTTDADSGVPHRTIRHGWQKFS